MTIWLDLNRDVNATMSHFQTCWGWHCTSASFKRTTGLPWREKPSHEYLWKMLILIWDLQDIIHLRWSMSVKGESVTRVNPFNSWNSIFFFFALGIVVEQSPHLMTPDQAKLKSVHRLKWMLSNGFWGLGEQTLSNSFAGTSIPWAGVYAPQSRLPSRRPIPPALPSRRLTKGTLVDLRQKNIRCSPEIHQICTRNSSDVHQKSIRCAPGMRQICSILTHR